MGWPKGKPRPPNSGRKKGTLNKIDTKARQTLREICEQEGIDPFLGMLRLAKSSSDEGIRAQMLKESCKYVYPQLKAIEHSGEIKNPYAALTLEQLEAMIKKKL